MMQNTKAKSPRSSRFKFAQTGLFGVPSVKLLNAAVLVLIIGLSSASVHASGKGRKNLSEPYDPFIQMKHIAQLFYPAPKNIVKERIAPHTFVVFVQGAQNHFVPPSQDDDQDVSRYGHADRQHAERVRHYASLSHSANVLLLHTQPMGASRFCSDRQNKVTTLEVFSRGQQIVSRQANILNGADPTVIEALMVSAYTWFAGSDVHFIYEGHGFAEGYIPTPLSEENAVKVNALTAFDINFPLTPYNINIFSNGFEKAKPNAALQITAKILSELTKYKDQKPKVAKSFRASLSEVIGEIKEARAAFKSNWPATQVGESVSASVNEVDLEKNLAQIQRLLPRAFGSLSFSKLAELTHQIRAVKKIAQPMASLTLAACSMETPHVRKTLWPLTQRLLASATPVFENLDQGFIFSFLADLRDEHTPAQVVDQIGAVIFENAEKQPNPSADGAVSNALLLG